MSCPICGGTLVGDGYTLVVHCENLGDVPNVEPDAGPLYCNYLTEEEMKEVCAWTSEELSWFGFRSNEEMDAALRLLYADLNEMDLPRQPGAFESFTMARSYCQK